MNHLPRAITFVLSVLSLACGGHVSGEDLRQPQESLLAGMQRGVAYSGFRHGQHPDRGEGAVLPTDEQILEDLKIIAFEEGFELIRLYDSQRNSEDVLRIIREHGIPLKVMLGIWLDGELSNHEGCAWVLEPVPEAELERKAAKNLREIEAGVRLANEYSDIVVAVNVGNESLVTWNDHLVSLESMIRHLKSVRSRIQQPVTTADNYKVFSQYGAELADHLDFLAVHTYPAWEEKTIDEALPYTIENLQEIRAVLPDMPIVVSEAGWASVASEFGDRASEESQARHYRELMEFGRANNITIFWFEAFDEDWKGNADPLGAEKHWGLYTIDREPKRAVQKE
ncbi:glycosyl hydrolase [Pelagicoccus sp. NFK12]|uniref:Endo-1,3-beta-glucanase btgC n=1 Tax=Pelagicoccus enzymogenes TaxID=2773457 RepID=A0A927F661_9BACT|nr:glycosyl hydrolase family 17 protein [Pelagicoccus enzymogenes]MBD5778579.1 glycosyl hydrolase [Pelagicoccus enzymogenes]